MNLPEHPHTHLKPLFDQREFVLATLDQINKDLQGLSSDFLDHSLVDENDRLSAVAASLAPKMSQLANLPGDQLAQFIYRVDLGEQKFIQSVQKDHTLQNLALLVIEREAQKVYLRKRFSGA